MTFLNLYYLYLAFALIIVIIYGLYSTEKPGKSS